MKLFVILSCFFGAAWACGPHLPCYLYYGIANRQDLVQGRIGIIEPNFPTSAKIVFYRHLAGLGMSPENQTQVLQYWARFWRYGKNPLPYTPKAGPEPLEQWNLVRASLSQAGPNPAINPFAIHDFTEYVNCGDDSFRSAAERLTQFLQQYGPSPEVLEWVRGQDAVFCHCGTPIAEAFPMSVQPNWPGWLRYERQYQLAAADFYAGRLTSAAQQLRAIEQDPESPYAPIAGYLAARALFRQAQFAGSEFEPLNGLVWAEQALNQIDNYLKKNPVWVQDAQKLRLRILARFFPQQAMSEMGRQLSTQDEITNLELVLWQYVNLYEAGVQPKTPDPLFNWLTNFTNGQTRTQEDSAAGRLCTLYSMPATDPQVAPLLAWVDSLNPADPAYGTALARAIHLCFEKGQIQQARQYWKKLDQFAKSRPEDIPLANECAGLGLPISEDWTSLFERMPRRIWAGDLAELADPVDTRQFDNDALGLFNQFLPLQRWIDFAARLESPDSLRQWVMEVALVRALLLNDEKTIRVLSQLFPYLSDYRTLCDSYLKSSDPNERKIQVLYFLLQHPGISTELRAPFFEWGGPEETNSIRGNWWQSQSQIFYGWRAPYAETKGQIPIQPPEVVSDEDQEQANRERENLKQCVPAPDYMTRNWLELAQTHPDHPLIAEGLYLAIRATRYGERGDQTSQWSQRAFRFLHKRYPESEWAKKAKYWY